MKVRGSGNLKRLMVLFMIAAVTFTMLLTQGCKGNQAKSQADDQVVAKVNGEPIYRKELVDELIKKFGDQVLNELIMKKLVMQEAKKEGITVSENEIDEYMKKLEKNMGGKETMEMRMKGAHISKEDMAKDIRSNLILKKLVLKTIDENDKEIFYETKIKNKAPYVELWMIVVPDKDLAKSIKEKLSLGEDFEKLAKKYSLLTYQGITNGYIGLVSRFDVEADRLVPKELAKYIFNAKVGDIIGPVLVERNHKKLYYILKITAIKKSYDDFKDEIEDVLASQKARDYLNNLREKADVEILLHKQESQGENETKESK